MSAEELCIGQWVRAVGLSRAGKIVSIDVKQGQAEIEIGGAAWTVPVEGLEVVDAPPGAEVAAPAETAVTSKARYELDLHGMRVEEGLEAMEKFIDSAVAHGIEAVRLIHGHGSGRLRRAIRTRLAAHPAVRDFHFGSPNEGGVGMTVANLKGA